MAACVTARSLECDEKNNLTPESWCFTPGKYKPLEQ
nr:MAG TPA: hypothetical protein [Caudoviricetes sp.]